jgi:hypothetical protein
VVIGFPVHRHVSVERMARRLAPYDYQRAAFFLRAEIEKVAARRLSAGLPVHIVEKQMEQFGRAVLRRLEVLDNLGGAA